MIDRFLQNLSKSVLAGGAIALGIAFIIFSDPPHTLCDAQVTNLKKVQNSFLFKKSFSSDDGFNISKMEYFSDYCKKTNTSGGCYELFGLLKKLIIDLDNINSECNGVVGDVGIVKSAIWKNLDLMTKLAWGYKPPEGAFEKTGWLNSADMNLFCKLKRLAFKYYGREEWNQFREKTFKKLPGSDSLDRNRIWELSILSLNCQSYL